MQHDVRGRLLVATPDLADPNFARTVVLVLEHTEEGALGVVLNRPTTTPVEMLFPAWEPVTSAPAVAFVGGPVAPDNVIALGRVASVPAGSSEALPGIATVDLSAGPDGVEAVRVFAGYAGWGPGQLDDELGAGGWFVVDAEPVDPLSDDPGQLWRTVLARQRGRLAWFANCPADPSTN